VLDFKSVPVDQVSQLGPLLSGEPPKAPTVEDGALG
jgi:hypothetical protein